LRSRRTLLAPVALALAFLLLAHAGNAYGAAVIHLPYPAGVSVSILQGYNGGTHTGVERYSLDLVRDDGKSSGSPALAPAPGTVVWAYAPGQLSGCIGIQIDGGDGLYEMLCHLILNHVYQNGEHVSGGQVLGSVGAPGTVENNGTSHIHLQLYRVVNGDRTPVPFATPDGLPLEGVSLPAGSSFNQWACNGGSGPGCHIVSLNGAGAGSAPPPAAQPSPTVTSASSSSSGGATISAPRQASIALAIGVPVVVAGTGDCLRVHDQPATSANQVSCLPDGTQAVITDGPQSANSYTWWKLDGLGWVVADYLTATGPGSIAPASAGQPAPTTTPAPAAPAAATASMPAAAPATAASPSPPPQLPIGVAFANGATVAVTGTGDCLRVHDQPALDGNVVDCLPDGTTGTIADGPVQADGYTWWQLQGEGWVDGEYLTSATAQ
jgi:hypothetical protein